MMSNILFQTNNSNLSKFSVIQTKIKLTTYSIMHELLQHPLQNHILFLMLIILESCQLLWFAIHPDFPFMWGDKFISYIWIGLEYLQVDAYIRANGSLEFYIFLYIAVSVQILMLMILIFMIVKLNKLRWNKSSLEVQLIRFLSIYALLMKTIAPLPMFQTFIIAIICRKDDVVYHEGITCYSGFNLFNLSIAAFAGVCFIIFSIVTQQLYIDLNPSSNLNIAAPLSNIDLFKLLLKLIIPIYLLADPELALGKPFILVYLVFWIAVMYSRCNSQPYYNDITSMFTILCEALVLWGAFVTNVNAFLASNDTDSIGFLYFLVAAPFFAYTCYRVYSRKRWQLIKKDTRSFSRPIEAEMYINLNNKLYDNRENFSERVNLEGLLRYHISFCGRTESGCPCMLIAADLNKSSSLNEREESSKKEDNWVNFINDLFQAALYMFPYSSRLYLHYAYFQLYKKKNKFKALNQLFITLENRPSIPEEFSVFRFKKIIEREMIDDDFRGLEAKTLDINQVVEFQEIFLELQNQIGNMVSLQLQFWNELGDPAFNTERLLLLGSRISVYIDSTKLLYKKLCELNENHYKLLRLYGNFTKEVLNENAEAIKLLDKKSNTAKRDFARANIAKYDGASDTCVITCSGNQWSLGQMLTASAETLDVLQYSSLEIIGQNINFIIPPILAEIHEVKLKDFFENGDQDKLKGHTLVFPMNKFGYIVPCSIGLKILPYLSEGVRIVSFIRQLNYESDVHLSFKSYETSANQPHYIMYGGENNVIQGVSESCYHQFGIPSRLTLGANLMNGEFTIDKIFPDLLIQPEEELKGDGMILNFSTLSLPDTFLVGDENRSNASNDEECLEELDLRRFRTAEVKVTLISTEKYEDTTIRIIKFIETDNLPKFRSDIEASEFQQKQASVINPAEREDDEVEMNVTQSEISVTTTGVQLSEEFHILKEVRGQISESTVPFIINHLKRVPSIFMIGLIVLAICQLYKNYAIFNEMKYGLQVARYGFQRHEIVADLNFKIRSLDLLSQGMMRYNGTLEAYEGGLRADIAYLVDELNFVQFKIIQGRTVINKTNGKVVIGNYPFKYLLIDGTILTKTITYNKMLWRYIGFVHRINNSSLQSFSAPLGINSTKDLVYYVETNGIANLRVGSEVIAESFMTFYLSRPDVFMKFFLITTLIAVVLVGILQIYLIFYVILVFKTKTMALSLFGCISSDLLHDLTFKCEQFVKIHLEELGIQVSDFNFRDHLNGQDDEQEEHKEDNINVTQENHYQQLIRSPTDPMSPTAMMSPHETSVQTGFVSPKPLVSPSSLISPTGSSHMSMRSLLKQDEQILRLRSPVRMPIGVLDTSPEVGRIGILRPQLRTNGMAVIKETDDLEQAAKEHQMEVEAMKEKSKKLQDLKGFTQGFTIIKMLSLTSLYIVYFVVIYVIEKEYMGVFQNGLRHLKVITERVPNLRYVNTFCLEEMAQNNLSLAYPFLSASALATKNSRTVYSNLVYENQQLLKTSLNKLPKRFKKYVDRTLLYNVENTCAVVNPTNTTAKRECEVINGVAFKTGLIQREDRLVEETKQIIDSFYATPNRTKQVLINYINSVKFRGTVQVLETIVPALEDLIELYMSTFFSYIDETNHQDVTILIVFVFTTILFYLIIWLPYTITLNKQINMTKGLLKMIPIDALRRNKVMRQAFIYNGVINLIK